MFLKELLNIYDTKLFNIHIYDFNRDQCGGQVYIGTLIVQSLSHVLDYKEVQPVNPKGNQS